MATLKRSVQKVRQEKFQGSLQTPTSRSDLVIPEQITTLVDGENFLLFDSGNNAQRIVIFGTQQGLEILARAENWYCDGTFKASPSLFEQLFIIHGQFRELILPLVYVLMPNRTQASYVRVLTALKNLKPTLAPTTIMSDFEQASINAFHAEFPAARQRGCFFHFSQCLWKHIQQYPSVAEDYREQPDFALNLKMMAALAFVPVADVGAAYDAFVDSDFATQNEDRLVALLAYFEGTWVGSIRGTRRRAPLFEIDLWNCRQSVLDEMGKTNNICEGYNRAINSMLSSAHPTIFKLIDCLKKQQDLTRARIEKATAGDSGAATSSKYKDMAQRLKNVVETYNVSPKDDRDIRNPAFLEYLRGVAHNIEYNV